MVGSFATPRLRSRPPRAQRRRSGPDRTLLGVGRRLDPLVIVGNDPYGDPVRSTVAGRVTQSTG